MRNDWLIYFISTILISFLLFLPKAYSETNTVSSTVVTNSTPPTASSPSVVVNNSDVCKTAVAGAVQTQILGISSGITISDENCERIKLSRSLYAMGMKVAAISTLCADSRVWDSMHMAGTPCPYMGAIGEEAKQGWLDNIEMIPEGSVVYAKIKEEELIEKQKQEISVRPLNDFEKFVIVGMAMYIGVPIIF